MMYRKLYRGIKTFMSMAQWNIRPVYDRRRIATETRAAKLEFEIYFSRSERMWLPTTIMLFPAEWDVQRGLVQHRPDAKRLNAAITNDIRRLDTILTNMEHEGMAVNRVNLKACIQPRKDKSEQNFIEWCRNELRKRPVRSSTRRMHNITLDALERSGVIKTFQDVTAANIKAFDEFLREEDSTRMQTTLYGYHKRLKSYINPAVRIGLLQQSPYVQFIAKHGKHKERQALTEEEVQRICRLKIADRSTAMVRDEFIFMCYTGLSFADFNLFSFFSNAEQHDGLWYINGERLKTGGKFFTPILPVAYDMLKAHNFKFREYTNQAFNRILKGIAIAAEITKPLTAHIARHTFATTIVLANDIPLETLMKMMGHSRIQVTQIYAKVLNSNVIRAGMKLTQQLGPTSQPALSQSQ